jgi:hypothetical protein
VSDEAWVGTLTLLGCGGDNKDWILGWNKGRIEERERESEAIDGGNEGSGTVVWLRFSFSGGGWWLLFGSILDCVICYLTLVLVFCDVKNLR